MDHLDILIKQKTLQREALQEGGGALDLEDIITLQQELQSLMEQKDLVWKQRAKRIGSNMEIEIQSISIFVPINAGEPIRFPELWM
jgi:hypothetical protein